MADYIKLAYSENEIASPNSKTSTEEKQSSPASVTDPLPIEESGAMVSENSSSDTDGTYEEANQPTSSGSEAQADEDEANKTSSHSKYSKTTPKTGEIPESTELYSSKQHSRGNEESIFDEVADEALRKSSMQIPPKTLPAKRLPEMSVFEEKITEEKIDEAPKNHLSRKAEELSGLVTTLPAKGRNFSTEKWNEEAWKLEIVQRLSRLPVVRCSAGLYQHAKGNQLLGGGMELMESCVWLTLRPLALTSSVISRMCSTPVGVADWVLCKALDVAQTVCPCVAVPPNQMCGVMVNGAKNCVCCGPRSVASGIKGVCSKAKRICN